MTMKRHHTTRNVRNAVINVNRAFVQSLSAVRTIIPVITKISIINDKSAVSTLNAWEWHSFLFCFVFIKRPNKLNDRVGTVFGHSPKILYNCFFVRAQVRHISVLVEKL